PLSTLVIRPGFEPELTEPKSVVLPLHHRTASLLSAGNAKVSIGRMKSKIPLEIFSSFLFPSPSRRSCSESPAPISRQGGQRPFGSFRFLQEIELGLPFPPDRKYNLWLRQPIHANW